MKRGTPILLLFFIIIICAYFVYAIVGHDLNQIFPGTSQNGAFVFDGNITSNGRLKDSSGFVAPVGSVQMFAGSVAPEGWLMCNGSVVSQTQYPELYSVIGDVYNTGGEGGGNFRVPDTRGIFPRGAGTHGVLTMANTSAFSANLGTYEYDAFQGHKHNMVNSGSYIFKPVGTGGNTYPPPNTNWVYEPIGDTDVPKSDGLNGNPRTGSETRPANLAFNFIIKY